MAAKELIEHPFCPTCGRVAPDSTHYACVPCANSGHSYRLILDETDRLATLTRWLSFWSEHGFTEKQIKAIPTYKNLTRYTFSRIRAIKSAKEEENATCPKTTT